MKRIVVIGGGPAGLTAAYEALKQLEDVEVVVLEGSEHFGGISRTVVYNSNRMDMGGHRFFSKIERVNDWWQAMLPHQGSPSYDDIVLDRRVKLSKGGPDPEAEDRVMLIRNRISRIYFERRFFDYPIKISLQMFKDMGIKNTISVGLSYMYSVFHKVPEKSLEGFYINRFGKKLYSMFFENYTENLWGRHPSKIAADWGAQRVKGLSIFAIVKDVIMKGLPFVKHKNVETSLIEEFSYPKLGPGQLWDVTAEEIVKLGGKVIKRAEVVGLHKENDKITSIIYRYLGSTDSNDNYSTPVGILDNSADNSYCIEADIVISSMPIKDLIERMEDVPKDIYKIATNLPYRDYMTLGVLVPKINLKNETKNRTLGNIVPDCWVYVHDRSVKMGRFQIYNNWSPYMIHRPEDTVWLGLEYFCNEGDSMWAMNEEEFARMALEEMVKINLISTTDVVMDYHLERVKKAYPAYFDSYKYIDKLIEYLNGIDNLYCVGRNGQHRYNNIDHSMCTSFETIKCIKDGIKDKSVIWEVNTEKVYHEGGKK